MNDELTPEARALVETARPGDLSDTQDQNRIRRSLATVLGVGAATTVSSAAVASGAFGGAMVTKIIVIAALATTAGAVTLFRPWERSAPDARPHTAAVQSPRAGVPLTSPTAPMLQATDQVDRTPTPQAAAVPVGRALPQLLPSRRLPERPENSPPVIAVAPPVTNTPTLEAELDALRHAQEALRGDDPQAALAAIDALATRTPDGAMTLERETTRVLALCALGRHQEAERLAAEIVREHPSSPVATRMRTPCGH